MKLFIALLVVSLTGCAGALKPYADWMNSQDACQKVGRPEGAPMPSYCGASAGKNITVTQGLTKNNYVIQRY